MAATPDPDAAKRYRRRYRDAFAPDLLTGLRIAVYQQRSVARDLMADLLTALGAAVVAIGRSETFVPIDTEDHRAEDVAFFRDTMASGGFDALVTTGGDADRPLVADATGRNLRGDVLGLITAPYLGVDAVVVPVTAGSAIERSGEFRRVTRTRVGSPFVIAGMEQVKRAGFDTVVGFAANGGFLLGAPLTIAGRPLPALPTRGAVLPILATLAAAREAGLTLAGLVAGLDAGEKASSRLPEIAPERSGALLARLTEAEFRRDVLAPVGTPVALDEQDGVRIDIDGGRTIHLRASGNAPELRCYGEAGSAAEAEGLVRWGWKPPRGP